MILRLFETAIEPTDVPDATDLFRVEVQPVLEGFPGCHSVEMMVGLDERSGDLVDILAISKWDSAGAIEKAVVTKEYDQAMQGLRKLFKRTPIVRHFEAGLRRTS